MSSQENVFIVESLYAAGSYENLLSVVADCGVTRTPIDLKQVEKIQPIIPSAKGGYFAEGPNDAFALVVPPATQTIVTFNKQIDSEGRTFRREPIFLRSSVLTDSFRAPEPDLLKSEVGFIRAARKIPGLIDLRPSEIPEWPLGTPQQYAYLTTKNSSAHGRARRLAWIVTAGAITAFAFAAGAVKIAEDSPGCRESAPSRGLYCRGAQTLDNKVLAPVLNRLLP